MDNRKKILIIDDEKYVREMIQLRLQEEDYDVVVASDAIEGLNISRSYKPDLIIIDLLMTGISGIEGIRKIRSDVSETVPILVLSGNTPDKEEAMKSGANAFLSKPVLPVKLVQEVHKMFK